MSDCNEKYCEYSAYYLDENNTIKRMLHEEDNSNHASIDELIIPVIAILNKKGYETVYSCSGHMATEDDDSIANNAYIAFRIRTDKVCVPFSTLPKYFEVEEPYYDFLIRRTFEDGKDMWIQILDTAKDLYLWALQLPNINKTIDIDFSKRSTSGDVKTVKDFILQEYQFATETKNRLLDICEKLNILDVDITRVNKSTVYDFILTKEREYYDNIREAISTSTSTKDGNPGITKDVNADEGFFRPLYIDGHLSEIHTKSISDSSDHVTIDMSRMPKFNNTTVLTNDIATAKDITGDSKLVNTLKYSTKDILDFIDNFKSMKDDFLYGKCYWFAVILRERFYGKIVYNPVENHWAFKIENLADLDMGVFDASGQISADGYSDWDDMKKTDKRHYERLTRQCINFNDTNTADLDKDDKTYLDNFTCGLRNPDSIKAMERLVKADTPKKYKVKIKLPTEDEWLSRRYYGTTRTNTRTFIEYGTDIIPRYQCPKCGGIVFEDASKILTSNPPKREFVCGTCDYTAYH